MTATPTKQRFRAILVREFAKHTWAKDEERYVRGMAAVDATLNGSRSCALTESWVLAWRELGFKGKPTYKALHALPDEVAA